MKKKFDPIVMPIKFMVLGGTIVTQRSETLLYKNTPHISRILYSDVQACAEGANEINQGGFVNCECKPGYAGDGFNVCADIDECADPSTNLCEAPATCQNTVGSFICNCPAEGYTKDPNDDHKCADINECETNNGGFVFFINTQMFWFEHLVSVF